MAQVSMKTGYPINRQPRGVISNPVRLERRPNMFVSDMHSVSLKYGGTNNSQAGMLGKKHDKTMTKVYVPVKSSRNPRRVGSKELVGGKAKKYEARRNAGAYWK